MAKTETKTAETTELATTAKTGELVPAEDRSLALPESRPDFLQSGDKRGMENMTKDDMTVPRLALAQAQSPQVTEGDPNFIEGLKIGDLFNSITKENYGRRVRVLVFRKDQLRAMEFRPIDEGGGIIRRNVPLNDPALNWGTSGNKAKDKPRATLFRDYLALILPTREMIALSFKSSGLRAAKVLNGLISSLNAPIFAGAFEISTGTELVPKPHRVYLIQGAGWVTPEEFAYAGKLWEAFKDLDVKIDIEATAEDVDDATSFDYGANVAERLDM